MDLRSLFGQLKTPRLICYHLFYPAHEEPLESCENWGEGAAFGSFAGEWCCEPCLRKAVRQPKSA